MDISFKAEFKLRYEGFVIFKFRRYEKIVLKRRLTENYLNKQCNDRFETSEKKMHGQEVSHNRATKPIGYV